MAARITVHGHFYQPPRENPWTGSIDVQPGAAPYRDWNARVHAESYKPNSCVTLPGPGDEPLEVNNFERLSFNLGPTLLEWMKDADRQTYDRILAADAASRARSGHGNALAQAYHHTILPLSPARDIRTQVRWGMRDFQHRFGRRAEGIWLPETAADERTIDVLIEEAVGFTILSPAQARYWSEAGGGWVDVAEEPLDTTVPYRCGHSDGSGRYVTVFFYDGGISHSIAFDGAAASAEGLTDLFETRAQPGCHLVHAATDGETYGHHHKFADIGLAYALFVEAGERGLETVNYATFLEECPAERWAQLPAAGTSWSCVHGVGRWKEDCGCFTGGEPGWNQKWRGPLRRALEVVRQSADEVYERLGRELFAHPWRARDRYIDVVSEARPLEELVAAEGAEGSSASVDRAGTLLELQRSSMSMFTSCGWFFNDVAGIETIQVLLYAARTMDLLHELDEAPPEERFLALLSEAHSNEPDAGTGAEIYTRAVAEARP